MCLGGPYKSALSFVLFCPIVEVVRAVSWKVVISCALYSQYTTTTLFTQLNIFFAGLYRRLKSLVTWFEKRWLDA